MTSTHFDRVSQIYNGANFSGLIYSRLLSQTALIERSKKHLDRVNGVVYRPGEHRAQDADPRGFPASTVVDARTAFWQGATARAAAQRTVSAMGLSLVADATGMMGARGLALWGNHPAALVVRASLPLRVAAWPVTLWNQNLMAHFGMLPFKELQLGSGLAEYVIGTGFEDRPQNSQTAPSYLVAAPPAFETFKVDGVLGLPERAVRGFAWQHRESSPLLAAVALAVATGLRLLKQPASLALCAVWGCEIVLGGAVGVAHVLSNHALQYATVLIQRLGSALHLNRKPSAPCTLGSFRAQLETEKPKSSSSSDASSPASSDATERGRDSTAPSSTSVSPSPDVKPEERLASYDDQEHPGSSAERPALKATHSIEQHGVV